MELPWRLFACIVALWLLVGLIPWLLLRDLHSAADFASTFSFVEALFGALAFGGVIWAIRLQTKELELQRLEVEETREELRRSADAQFQSQQMHFLSALLTARNNVAQGYASAAAYESGPLQPSRLAHRQHLVELEWLLQVVDRHESNPFAIPKLPTLVAHQVGQLLRRAHPALQAALQHRAANHLRGIMLDLNQSLREMRRLLAQETEPCELCGLLDDSIRQAETVSTANDFDETAEISVRVYGGLRAGLEPAIGDCLPPLQTSDLSVRQAIQ